MASGSTGAIITCEARRSGGIIEGASQGKGLGLAFLRHIMRTRILLFVLDGSEERPSETLSLLRKELVDFDWRLGEKPYIIALNKIDLLDNDRLSQLNVELGEDSLKTSGLTGYGIEELKAALAGKLRLYE